MFTSGNIPDLFDPDELDSLLMDIKNEAMIENIADEKSILHKYLINVCFLKDCILFFEVYFLNLISIREYNLIFIWFFQ